MSSVLALDDEEAMRVAASTYADLLCDLRERRRRLEICPGDLVLALLLSPATFSDDAMAYLRDSWGTS